MESVSEKAPIITVRSLSDMIAAARPDLEAVQIAEVVSAVAPAASVRAALEGMWEADASVLLSDSVLTYDTASADNSALSPEQCLLQHVLGVDRREDPSGREHFVERESEALIDELLSGGKDPAAGRDWTWYLPAPRDVRVVPFLPRCDDYCINTAPLTTELGDTAAPLWKSCLLDVVPPASSSSSPIPRRFECIKRSVARPSAAGGRSAVVRVTSWSGSEPVATGAGDLAQFVDVFSRYGGTAFSLSAELARHAEELRRRRADVPAVILPLLRALMFDQTLHREVSHRQLLGAHWRICIGPIRCRYMDIPSATGLQMYPLGTRDFMHVEIKDLVFALHPVWVVVVVDGGGQQSAGREEDQGCVCGLSPLLAREEERRWFQRDAESVPPPQPTPRAVPPNSQASDAYLIAVTCEAASLACDVDVRTRITPGSATTVAVRRSSVALHRMEVDITACGRPLASALLTAFAAVLTPLLRPLIEDRLVAFIDGDHDLT